MYPLCSNRMSVMGLVNHFLIEFKALSSRQGSCLAPLTKPRIHGLVDTGPRGEPITIILLNGHSVNLPSKNLQVCAGLNPHPRSFSLQ